MAAASERRLNELTDSAAVAPPAEAGEASGGGRRFRVAVVAVILGVECAWLAAIAYVVWRLVTLV